MFHGDENAGSVFLCSGGASLMTTPPANSDALTATATTATVAADAAPALVYPTPLTAADIEAYDELRRDAAWFESAGRWSSVQGPKAAEALNGLVTNDVTLIPVGGGQHAVALTPKGKVVCDMLIIRPDEHTFLLTILATAADAWLALARKYINPRLAKVTDESARYCTWMLYGAQAPHAVALLGGGTHTSDELASGMADTLSQWHEWKHDLWNIGPASVRLIRAPLMGNLPGFVIMAEALDADVVRSRLEASNCRRAARAVWNIARIEGGRPAMGVDMDENTIPQEANLDTLGAISFTKGCYTGQETVARVHFRGHVNRHLRGLLGALPLPQHGRVLDATGKDVGDVRSTCISPRLGPLAMAMIRREVEPGSQVTVTTPSGAITAQVVTLPFDSGN
jgi:folate-binding protein YgfZ